MDSFHMENCFGEKVGVDFYPNFERELEQQRMCGLINSCCLVFAEVGDELAVVCIAIESSN
jgi:hypothetical protein